MTVTFTEPTHSVWTLVTKTEEDNYQSPAGNIGASIAWALFTCHNPHNHDEEALVRIYMQIPNSGTEFELPHQRAQQAKPELDSFAKGELDAITRLTNVGAQHAPTIIGKRQGIQSDSGMVPGGFVLYLAMTKLRGRRLSDGIIEDSLFWRLPMTTRDLIREAFKIAYQYVRILYIVLIPQTLLTHYSTKQGSSRCRHCPSLRNEEPDMGRTKRAQRRFRSEHVSTCLIRDYSKSLVKQFLRG
jgi:hypothetical protein